MLPNRQIFYLLPLLLANSLGVFFTGFGWYALYTPSWPLPNHYQMALLLGLLLSTPILFSTGSYRYGLRDDSNSEIWAITLGWILTAVTLILLAFSSKLSSEFSRFWFALWISSAWILQLLTHKSFKILRHWQAQHSSEYIKILLIGDASFSQQVAQHLKNHPLLGMQVSGFLGHDAHNEEDTPSSLPYLGQTTDLLEILAKTNFEEVWLTLPLSASEEMLNLTDMLRQLPCAVRYVPDVLDLRLLHHGINDLSGLPVIDLAISPITGLNKIVKTIEDYFVASSALLLVSPLILLIAITLKLTSRQPILYKQMRHGLGGKPIKIYKFRTMKAHTEMPGTVTQASRNDPRLTRLGKLLRRYSLDELPQLFNVLQGRMSIVGPRPHAIEHNDYYRPLVDDYMQRHQINPGITGWAQVNGFRGKTTKISAMQHRVEYDLYYIENWSILLDFRILLLTVLRGFSGQNTY